MTQRRVSRIAAEVLETDPTPQVRVSRVAAEVLEHDPSPQSRVSRVAIEVLQSVDIEVGGSFDIIKVEGEDLDLSEAVLDFLAPVRLHGETTELSESVLKFVVGEVFDLIEVEGEDLDLSEAILRVITTFAFGDLVSTIDEPVGALLLPARLAWEGTNFLITVASTSRVYVVSKTPTILDASAALADFGLNGVAFDGTDIWALITPDHELLRLDLTTLAVEETLPIDAGITDDLFALEYDPRDGNFWVANSLDETIYKIDRTDGSEISSFANPGPGSEVTIGLAWDGTYLWAITGAITDWIAYRLDPDTGATVSSFDPGLDSAQGATYDGELLWISDSATNALYGYFVGEEFIADIVKVEAEDLEISETDLDVIGAVIAPQFEGWGIPV